MPGKADIGFKPETVDTGFAMDPASDVTWRDGVNEPSQKQKIKRIEPRTVAAGFEEFCDRLKPQYSEPPESAARLQLIEDCLSRRYDVAYVAPYGSCSHGTNVREFSAIDNFAVIPKSVLFENSTKSLEQMAEHLRTELPDASVTGGRPVVCVPFGEELSERHHIVPAFVSESQGDHDVYYIPAPSDRWIGVCPAAHSIWINDLDAELQNNLKRFVRVVKAWSHYNGGVIWSYYLELCAADFLKNDRKIIYSQDLCSFFNYLLNRKLAPFENAAGCTELVYGTTIDDKKSALATIRRSLKLAEKAVTCEAQENIADAFYWWRKVFDWRFATY